MMLGYLSRMSLHITSPREEVERTSYITSYHLTSYSTSFSITTYTSPPFRICYGLHHLLGRRPEITIPPRKELGIDLGIRYEIGESFNAAANRSSRVMDRQSDQEYQSGLRHCLDVKAVIHSLQAADRKSRVVTLGEATAWSVKGPAADVPGEVGWLVPRFGSGCSYAMQLLSIMGYSIKTTTLKVFGGHAMPWRTLKKMMTDKYSPRGEIKKLEFEMWNLKVKGTDVADNKRKSDDIARNNQNQQPNKRQNTRRAYAAVNGDRRPYEGPRPLNPPNVNTRANQRVCFKYGAQGHFKKDCLKLKNNNNRGNQVGNAKAQAKVYAVGNAGENPDNNVVTGTFLLNNRYESILFDTGADRSFVSTTFSSRIVITPTALDHDYNVKLADGRIVGLNTIIRGCTLNFLNHPFNIDLMPVELETNFNRSIGEEAINEQGLIKTSSRVTKAQEYLMKDVVFLANITGTNDVESQEDTT
ncbi:putative reverse transcriptase domain-containing protein [Tanacetum coccineum]